MPFNPRRIGAVRRQISAGAGALAHTYANYRGYATAFGYYNRSPWTPKGRRVPQRYGVVSSRRMPRFYQSRGSARRMYTGQTRLRRSGGGGRGTKRSWGMF